MDATTPGIVTTWGAWEPKRSDILTGSATPMDDFRHAVKHGHIDAIKLFIEQGIYTSIFSEEFVSLGASVYG